MMLMIFVFRVRPTSAGYMALVSQLPALKQDEKANESGDVRVKAPIHR